MFFPPVIVFLLFFKGTVSDKTDEATTAISVNSETGSVSEAPITFGDCGGAILISDEKNSTYNVSSPFDKSNSKLYVYPPGGVCKWEFIGDPSCSVQIVCAETDFVKPAGEKCTEKDEHLEITDGTGGSERFCGKSKFDGPIVASKGLRDIYVNFKVSNSTEVERGGFKCQLSCRNETAQARPLKITKKRKENKHCACGTKQKPKTTRKKRVVEGNDAGLNEWPWQVAIVKPGTRSSFCGGAILNSRHILTAAHCFFFAKTTPDQIEILLHARQLDRTDKKELRVRKPPESAIAKYKEKLQKLLSGAALPGGLHNFSNPALPDATKFQNLSAPGLQNTSAIGGGDALKPKLPPVGADKVPTAPGGDALKKQVPPVGGDKVPTAPGADALKPNLPVGGGKGPKGKGKPPIPPIGKPKTPLDGLGGLGGLGALAFARRRRATKQKNPNPLDPLGGIKTPDAGDVGNIQVIKLKNLTDKDERTRRFKVRKITTHPLFTAAYDFDVAVVELDREIDLKSKTVDDHTALCLPPLGYKEKYVGAKPYVVGWGLKKEDENVTDGTLHQLQVNVMDSTKCQNWTEYEITTRMMCAGYEKGSKDACVGDSGGPLNYQNKLKQWFQIGIVSWGEGCARELKPGMYSRVTELSQWVLHHTFGNGKWCKDGQGD